MKSLLIRLQQTLPKPLLFGLYGSLGGLLGALLLGEFLWALLRPAAARRQTVPPLQMVVSPSVSV